MPSEFIGQYTHRRRGVSVQEQEKRDELRMEMLGLSRRSRDVDDQGSSLGSMIQPQGTLKRSWNKRCFLGKEAAMSGSCERQ